MADIPHAAKAERRVHHHVQFLAKFSSVVYESLAWHSNRGGDYLALVLLLGGIHGEVVPWDDIPLVANNRSGRIPPSEPCIGSFVDALIFEPVDDKPDGNSLAFHSMYAPILQESFQGTGAGQIGQPYMA